MSGTIKMNKDIKSLPLTLFPENSRLDCPEPNEELIKSIKEYGVIYPIVIAEKDGGYEVIDGRRRIKVARLLEHRVIKTINYSGLSEQDKAMWALILNDQRSDNIVTEFLYYTKLVENNDWDTLREHGFNKNHVQKILSLGKIKEREKMTDAYQRGLVAATTLFEMAKLGEERQEYLVSILETKGKLALSDVREAKKVKTNEAVMSMPSLTPTVTQATTVIEFAFAVAMPDSNEAILFSDIQDAYEVKEKNNGARLFKIFEV